MPNLLTVGFMPVPPGHRQQFPPAVTLSITSFTIIIRALAWNEVMYSVEPIACVMSPVNITIPQGSQAIGKLFHYYTDPNSREMSEVVFMKATSHKSSDSPAM